jgi:hypothetical protein
MSIPPVKSRWCSDESIARGKRTAKDPCIPFFAANAAAVRAFTAPGSDARHPYGGG